MSEGEAGDASARREGAEVAERCTFDQRVELAGTAVPESNNAHAHPTMTAENLLQVEGSPEVATDERQLVELLPAEAVALDSGDWVVGSRYDQSETPGGPVVDRAFPDAIVPDHPVLLVHVTLHWGIANSVGLRVAGLDQDGSVPAGGARGRDRRGELNGVLNEQALFDLANPSLVSGPTIAPPSELAARLRGLERRRGCSTQQALPL